MPDQPRWVPPFLRELRAGSVPPEHTLNATSHALLRDGRQVRQWTPAPATGSPQVVNSLLTRSVPRQRDDKAIQMGVASMPAGLLCTTLNAFRFAGPIVWTGDAQSGFFVPNRFDPWSGSRACADAFAPDADMAGKCDMGSTAPKAGGTTL